MTNEEAIQEIKDSIEADDVWSHEALEMAIEALEKQIPKSGYNEDKICVCPSCKRLLEGHEYYCWNCGQKIVFEEVSE